MHNHYTFLTLKLHWNGMSSSRCGRLVSERKTAYGTRRNIGDLLIYYGAGS
jgi:hypothetical protein